MNYDPTTNPVDKAIQKLIDMGIITMISFGGEPLVGLTEYGKALARGERPDSQHLTEEDERNLENFLKCVDKDLDKLKRT